MKDFGKKIKSFFAEKVKPFLMNNNKRNLKICIIVIVSLLIIAGTVTGIYVYRKLSLIDSGNKGIDYSNSDHDLDDEGDDPNLNAMHDVGDAASLNAWLKSWATNGGDKMSSKKVVNVLLLGVDSTDGSGTGARSDCMIVVSLNKETKKISLVSFLRDSYSYININGEDRWRKVNAVNNWGGPGTLLETLENNYKIEIDGYVSVDFKSFPQIIDALGGVTVDVKEYEARYINNNSHGFIAYNPTRPFPSGDDVKLQGQEALIFSRIRKCDADSDLSRTRRQRSVIMALIESAKGATNGQINNAMNIAFPFVRTSFTNTELLSLATKATAQGWMDFDIEQLITPNINAGGTGKSASINSEFVWIVDYAKAAQELQLALYGKTNIQLDDDGSRTSPLDMLVTKNQNSNSGSNNSLNKPNDKNDPTTNTASKEPSATTPNTKPVKPDGGSTTSPTKPTTHPDNNSSTTPGQSGVDPSDTIVTDSGNSGSGSIGDTPDLDLGDIL